MFYVRLSTCSDAVDNALAKKESSRDFVMFVAREERKGRRFRVAKAVAQRS